MGRPQGTGFSAHLPHRGPGIIYTDGYNQSTGPNYFPKIAQLPFLGQFESSYATNILSIYQNFGRGNQVGKYSTPDFAAFERQDKTENATMSYADGTVLLVMLGALRRCGWPKS